MTEQRYRFCPRCGTELVAGMPFCPNCGLNTAGTRPAPDAGDAAEPPPPARDDPFETVDWSRPESGTEAPRVATPVAPGPRPELRTTPSSPNMPLIVGIAVVAAVLIAYALLSRPLAGTPAQPSPQVVGSGGVIASFQPGVSQAVPSAPIMGLSIQSPTDGQTVATRDVTVIGLAPPGLRITRDISFGFDQHAIADGTGHWAISVQLSEGQNELVFRIGDDRSTEQRIRVTYAPPQAS